MRIHLTLDVAHIDQDDELFPALLKQLRSSNAYQARTYRRMFNMAAEDVSFQLADDPFEVQAGHRTSDGLERMYEAG